MSVPCVSIVIPTYERPTLLRRALDSVLAQTYSDWEAIVVDDAATGSAEPVVSGVDARVRYVKNDGVHGGAGARNRGIQEARGEYVAFLDDDDEWVPEKLARQVAAMDSAPADVGFCATAVTNVFDTEERRTRTEEGITDFSDIALRRFKGFLTSTLFVRRHVFDEIGLFDTSLPSHQEAELVLRITRKYRGFGIDEPLVRMNMASQHVHIGGDLGRRIQGRELLLQKHAILFAQHPRILARHYYWLGLWYRDAGRHVEARGAFGRAWQLSWQPRYLLYWLIALIRTVV